MDNGRWGMTSPKKEKYDNKKTTEMTSLEKKVTSLKERKWYKSVYKHEKKKITENNNKQQQQQNTTVQTKPLKNNWQQQQNMLLSVPAAHREK